MIRFEEEIGKLRHKVTATSEDMDKLLVTIQQQANRILSLESQVELLEKQLKGE